MFRRQTKAPEENNHIPVEHRRGHIHVVVDRNLCFYCGACVAVCPPDAIFLENHYLKIDDETCTLCDRCTTMCPVHALTMQPIVQPALSAKATP